MDGVAKYAKHPVSCIVRELQAIIKVHRLNAYDLARMTGLRVSTTQRLMAGQGSPTISTLDAVAKALGRRIKTEPCQH